VFTRARPCPYPEPHESTLHFHILRSVRVLNSHPCCTKNFVWISLLSRAC
jgi:hypothetical protein